MQPLSNTDFKRLDNGVYIITTLTGTRQTIKELFHWIDYMQAHAVEGTPIRYVLDVRNSGFPSLNGLYNEASTWFKEHPNYHPVRTLFVLDNVMVASMGSSLAALLQRDSNTKWKFRFVNSDKYDEGMQWLLSNE